MPAKHKEIDWTDKVVKEGLDALGKLMIEDMKRPSVWDLMIKIGWIIPKGKNSDTIKVSDAVSFGEEV